jgi:hypothetical protein
VVGVSESSPDKDKAAGIDPAGFPGQFHPAAHGQEPGQTDLGPRPGSNYLGYVDDPEDPDRFTIQRRDADVEDILHRFITVNEHVVVELGEWR